MYMILIAAICLLASAAGAVCGIGGGVVIKPVLDALGIMPVATVSFLSGITVLCMTCYSVGMAAVKRESKLELNTILPLSIGAALGGVAGKAMFHLLQNAFSSSEKIGAVQAACLFILSVGTLFYTLNKNKIKTCHLVATFPCVAAGTALGVASAFLGIGGGPFNLVILGYLFSMKTKTAAQNSLFIILCSQAAGLIQSIATHSIPHFEPIVLALMAAMGIAGGVVGRKINSMIPDENVDRLFIGMDMLIICICVYNFFSFV